jgi:hypothetical protein
MIFFLILKFIQMTFLIFHQERKLANVPREILVPQKSRIILEPASQTWK